MVSLSEGHNGKTLSYVPPAEVPASELRSLYVRQCKKDKEILIADVDQEQVRNSANMMG